MIAALVAASFFSWTQAGPSDRLALRPGVDAVIAGAGLIGFVVPELFKERLAPAHCLLCDGGDNSGLPGTGSRGSLDGIDAYFHDAMTGWLMPRATADKVSDVLVYGVLPAGGLAAAFFATGPQGNDGAGVRAAAIVIESVLVQGAVVQAVKFIAARKRPFVRYGDGETSGTYDVNGRDSHISLPSGHTGFAAALGTSVAMTATLQDSPAAPWLWGAAAAATVVTGSLRMMAEKHYFTDVVTGAAIGAASGVLFPLLHRRGSALDGSTVALGAQGPMLSLAGRF